MYWCVIDWCKSVKGKYFFLEVNFSFYFLKVENDIGLDIIEKLVVLLVKIL